MRADHHHLVDTVAKYIEKTCNVYAYPQLKCKDDSFQVKLGRCEAVLDELRVGFDLELQPQGRNRPTTHRAPPRIFLTSK
ncbi:hypothetical protein CASFOL_003747 [Castilleja foliolosa]|uniref:Uncharacterized protein n=1 Tax=Castilleja foliolosa TaxID=1961234 RepID=A0ABD3EIF6_9LAMI